VNTLLAHALISLTRVYKRIPARPTLPFYAVVLRPLEFDGVAVKDFPKQARISKRAATTLLKEAENAGLVTRQDKVVRLTDAGLRMRFAGATRLTAAEAEWSGTSTLRGPLEALVSGFELEHPHYVMTYGMADTSAIGGRYPGHGDDWKPVPRVDAGSAAGLPISALLSQALMDFAIRYEAGPTLALSSTVHALLKFPDGGLLLTESPPLAGLTGDGKCLLERHGLVVVDNGGGDKRMRRATLTPRGKSCRDAYGPNVARVEDEWRQAHGDATVEALRDALTHVDATLEPGLADHPFIRFFGGLDEASS